MHGAILCLALLGLLAHTPSAWAQIGNPGLGSDATGGTASRQLHLEVFINGTSTNLIAAFQEEADGTFLIAAEQLGNVGILPEERATRADGLVDTSRLGRVSYRYDEASQSIHFDAGEEALAAHVIDAHAPRPRLEPQISTGGLLNYTLYGSSGGETFWGERAYEGGSAGLDARLFGRFGTISTGLVVNTSSSWQSHFTRLDTTWSYSAPGSLTTYSIGDFVSGGLSWTRPLRMGGFQVRRNFELRPDLITMPLPQISGSAAVPSTVDLYVENARRLSRNVPAGPFEIINLPAMSGRGSARVVVQDSLGRETVVESPFFSSARLLRQGLLDYSAEIGVARRSFGVESNDYDDEPSGSGSLRYGFRDALTLEGHVEGGPSVINAGAGAVFGLSHYGVGNLAVAGSGYDNSAGMLVSAGVELDPGFVHISARSQRTFGSYGDVAAVGGRSEEILDQPLHLTAPPKALDQISIALPLGFDPASISASYTHVDSHDSRSQILGFSAARPIGRRASVFASGFQDLDERDAFGVFVGLSFPLGGKLQGSVGMTADSRGPSFRGEVIKPEEPRVGAYGWRLRDVEGAVTNRLVSASYRSSFARFQAGVEQAGESFRTSGQMEGAIVAGGGGVFLSTPISDAFAVVDAGAPDVPVELENRPVGRTDSRGRILVPGLRSYEANRISIDPTDLPVDALVQETRQVAVPADRAGVTLSFGVQDEAQAALVTLVEEDGGYVPLGSTVMLAGNDEGFIVGYDGQTFINDLSQNNQVIVERSTGGQCQAEFSFRARRGAQVAIPAVTCHPID